MFGRQFAPIFRHPDAPLLSFLLTVDFPGLHGNGSSSQFIDQAQNFLEQAYWYGNLGHLQSDVMPLADDLHPATRPRSSVKFARSEFRSVWHHKLKGKSPYEMSAMGQKRKSAAATRMSAFGVRTDMA